MMHLSINGVLLSAPPDFDGVQVREVTEVARETSIKGAPYVRVAEKRSWEIQLRNTQDNGINLDERYDLGEIQLGDVITLEENYTRRNTVVRTGCVVVAREPMLRLLKDKDDSTAKGDFFSWGFTLLYTEA
jgi:hypothetical protein